MKQREFIDVDTSTNATLPPRTTKETEEAPGLPVKIPLSWVRWVAYTMVFTLLLFPYWEDTGLKMVSTAAILAWFASQLNALINKK